MTRTSCAACTKKFLTSERQIEKILSTWNFDKGPEEIPVNKALSRIFENLPSKNSSCISTGIFQPSTKMCSSCAKSLSLLYNAFMDFLNVCQTKSDILIAFEQLHQLRQRIFVDVSTRSAWDKSNRKRRRVGELSVLENPQLNTRKPDCDPCKTEAKNFIVVETDTDSLNIKDEVLSDVELEPQDDNDNIANLTFEDNSNDDDVDERMLLEPEFPSSPVVEENSNTKRRLNSLRLQPKKNKRYGEEEDNLNQSEDENDEHEQEDDYVAEENDEDEDDDNFYPYISRSRRSNYSKIDTPNITSTNHGQRKCAHCGEILSTMYGLKRHIQRVHPDEKIIIKCDQKGCKCTFDQDYDYRKHQCESHDLPVKVVNRTILKEAKDDKNPENQDNNMFRSDTLRKCGYCYKMFARAHGLKRHIRTVHKKKQFVVLCDREGCDSSFHGKDFEEELREHLVNKHGMKTFYKKPRKPTPKGPNWYSKKHWKGRVERLCGHCQQSCHNSFALQRHILMQHDGKDFLIKCHHECNETFSDDIGLKQHRVDSHGYPECTITATKERPEPKWIKRPMDIVLDSRCCGYCDKVFRDVYYLKGHTQKFHKKDPTDYRIRCDETECGAILDTDMEFINHRAAIHGKGKSAQIRLTKPDVRNLKEAMGINGFTKRHRSIANWDNVRRCGHCDQVYSSIYVLRRHVRAFHKDKDLAIKCNVNDGCDCQELFNDNIKFKDHLENTHGQKVAAERRIEKRINRDYAGRRPKNLQIQCGYCGKEFNRLHPLKKHTEIEHKTEDNDGFELTIIIKCVEMECGFTFNSIDEFRRHGVEVHGHKEKFICAVCEIEYERPVHLQSHMERIHCVRTDKGPTGDHNKEYTCCHICGKLTLKGFSFRRHLASHQNTSNVAKVKCPQCDKLVKLDSLDRHMMMKHVDSEIIVGC